MSFVFGYVSFGLFIPYHGPTISDVFTRTDIGNNAFNYTLNITICSGVTFCPNPNNETCCYNNKDIREIEYSNNAFIPTAATALPSYYAVGGYTIPTVTPITSSGVSGTASTTLIPSTLTPNLHRAPSGLGAGAKAGIIVGVVGGVVVLGAMLFFLLRHCRRRRRQRTNCSALKPVREMDSETLQRYDRSEMTWEPVGSDGCYA